MVTVSGEGHHLNCENPLRGNCIEKFKTQRGYLENWLKSEFLAIIEMTSLFRVVSSKKVSKV